MNRCLTEGRRSFHDRLAGIESGAECERLAPLVSALADGEARAEDMAALRPHLRTCLACRARLREYREAPERAAALVPPVAGVPLAIAWLQERAVGLATRWHALIDVASASKIAAVTASTAVLAGGGVATVTTAGGPEESRPAPHAVSRSVEPPRDPPGGAATAPIAPPRRERPAGSRRANAAGRPAQAATPNPPASTPEPPDGPGGEFAP